MSALYQLPDHILQTNIGQLRLPARIQRSLIRARIKTIGELATLCESDIFRIQGIGQAAYNDIVRALNVLAASLDSGNQIDWEAYRKVQGLKPEVKPEEKVITTEIELPKDVKHLSLGHLHLPLRTYNTLTRANILTIGNLLTAINTRLLLGLQGLGSDSVVIMKNALATLAETIDANNEINWIDYYNRQKIIVIPNNYKDDTSPAEHVKQLTDLVKEILIQDDDDRDWRVIQRRFGLNGTKKLTLEQLGEGFGLTRERVRQIERKAILELRSVLIENQYSGRAYHVHPKILTTVKFLFDTLATQTKEYILETDLFELVQQALGTEISKSRPIFVLLFTINSMNRIEFNDPDLVAVWEQMVSDQREILERVVTRLDNLLTRDVATPMEEFDILRSINKDLPKDKKLTPLQLRRFVELCSTIEQRDDGLFWGKFEYLKSRGNQVERLLVEADKPMSITDLTRVINSKLVIHGRRKLTERNLANQLPHDDRFMPIGRSGDWALKSWKHIDTSNVITLMERYLHEQNEPATTEEIFEYVNSLRSVSAGSIKLYLSNERKLFQRADRIRWGLASWSETQNAVTWSPEQVADFVATLFKKYKTNELEFKVVREALMNESGVSSKQAVGMLTANPVITTRKGIKSNERFAVFQPSYKSDLATFGARFTRKQTTQREKLEEIVHQQLETALGFQIPLSEIILLLTSKHGFNNKTAYLYLRQAESIEPLIVPGTRTKICRLKDKQGLSFPQLSSITDTSLRESIEKAILDLNEENIDLGLFQLGREFEVVIKKSLARGSSKGKIALSTALGRDSNKWKLANMVDCSKDNGLITDLGVTNLLRQERNNRAHGSRPSLAERRALVNAAQYIAGMYIDYIILFEEFFNTLK